jgi:hypothetical protein
MKKILLCLAAGAALVLAAGCSTVESRIKSHQTSFDTWPAEIRDRVRAGRVAVGFTAEMVQVALGQPDRAFARTTERGSSEVWVFLDSGPKFSIGIGVGGYNGSTAYGGGVTLVDDGFRDNEVLRVILEGGRVVAIEARRR